MTARHLARIALAVAPLVLLACGGPNVGRACTLSADCDRGQECYTQAPAGFCSKGCSAEGSFAECPGDSICAQNSGLLLCAPICREQGDCRPEYECVGVANNAQKACRPKART